MPPPKGAFGCCYRPPPPRPVVPTFLSVAASPPSTRPRGCPLARLPVPFFHNQLSHPQAPTPRPTPLPPPHPCARGPHLVQEADLSLGGVQVDLHVARRQPHVQEGPWPAALLAAGARLGPGQRGGVQALERAAQVRRLHQAAVDEKDDGGAAAVVIDA
eukprot:121479-Chlamydomonas_euryale.AAC.1